jgi:8-oxo-dGTP diphosphatase
MLVGKRKGVGKWELPGGKVEEGEAFIHAIIRELREELDVSFTPFLYCGRYEHGNIDLYMYAGRIDSEDEPKCLVHDEIKWVTLKEIDELEWIESADMLEYVKEYLMKG